MIGLDLWLDLSIETNRNKEPLSGSTQPIAWRTDYSCVPIFTASTQYLYARML